MGQYYNAVNIDKKQVFWFDGAKMMEFSWLANRSVHALMVLMAGPWKGDRVYVVGDYADHSEGPYEGEDAWLHVYDAAVRFLGIENATYTSEHDGKDYPENLYQHADHQFENVTEDAMKRAAEGERLRYILNPELGVFVDLQHCPADSVSYWKDGDEAFAWRVHPLPLLLAMGNGRGGGDFRGSYVPFVDLHEERRTVRRVTNMAVGAWTPTSANILFAKEGEEAKLQGLREWQPAFSEEENPIPWQDIPARLEEARAKGREKAAQAA